DDQRAAPRREPAGDRQPAGCKSGSGADAGGRARAGTAHTDGRDHGDGQEPADDRRPDPEPVADGEPAADRARLVTLAAGSSTKASGVHAQPADQAVQPGREDEQGPVGAGEGGAGADREAVGAAAGQLPAEPEPADPTVQRQADERGGQA